MASLNTSYGTTAIGSAKLRDTTVLAPHVTKTTVEKLEQCLPYTLGILLTFMLTPHPVCCHVCISTSPSPTQESVSKYLLSICHLSEPRNAKMLRVGTIPALFEVTGYRADGQWGKKSTQIKIKLRIVSSDCEEACRCHKAAWFECELSWKLMHLNIRSPAGGTILGYCGNFGGGASLEETGHDMWLYSLVPVPTLCFLDCRDVRSDSTLLAPHDTSTIMDYTFQL